ncbi:hypothetical protein J6590_086392 [Homalodisca vitripennis]|nr:hypothetical protein J6590_086392 [Homalodisca vitripennis]
MSALPCNEHLHLDEFAVVAQYRQLPRVVVCPLSWKMNPLPQETRGETGNQEVIRDGGDPQSLIVADFPRELLSLQFHSRPIGL